MFAQYKLIIIGIAVLALIGSVTAWVIGYGNDRAQEARDEVIAEYTARAEKQRNESLAKEKADRDELQRISATYEQQITDLRNTARPVPLIRVPKCPGPVSVSSAATVTGESSPETPGEPSRTDGRDSPEIQLSHDLRDYAKEFQACALRVNAIIDAWPR